MVGKSQITPSHATYR